MTYHVGLTGGIASGKSSAANLFAKHNIAIIDADAIAREVIMPGQTAYNTILAHFGKMILNEQHHIDRTKLRHIVFNDPQKLLWLEELLHPLIRDKMTIYSQQVVSPYCIHVIPLLVETLPYPGLNRILVIDVSVEIQITRLKEREHMDDQMIQKILDSQISREARLTYADDILVNDGDLRALAVAVDKLHEKYLHYAIQHKKP